MTPGKDAAGGFLVHVGRVRLPQSSPALWLTCKSTVVIAGPSSSAWHSSSIAGHSEKVAKELPRTKAGTGQFKRPIFNRSREIWDPARVRDVVSLTRGRLLADMSGGWKSASSSA